MGRRPGHCGGSASFSRRKYPLVHLADRCPPAGGFSPDIQSLLPRLVCQQLEDAGASLRYSMRRVPVGYDQSQFNAAISGILKRAGLADIKFDLRIVPSFICRHTDAGATQSAIIDFQASAESIEAALSALRKQIFVDADGQSFSVDLVPTLLNHRSHRRPQAAPADKKPWENCPIYQALVAKAESWRSSSVTINLAFSHQPRLSMELQAALHKDGAPVTHVPMPGAPVPIPDDREMIDEILAKSLDPRKKARKKPTSSPTDKPPRRPKNSPKSRSRKRKIS